MHAQILKYLFDFCDTYFIFKAWKSISLRIFPFCKVINFFRDTCFFDILIFSRYLFFWHTYLRSRGRDKDSVPKHPRRCSTIFCNGFEAMHIDHLILIHQSGCLGTESLSLPSRSSFLSGICPSVSLSVDTKKLAYRSVSDDRPSLIGVCKIARSLTRVNLVLKKRKVTQKTSMSKK